MLTIRREGRADRPVVDALLRDAFRGPAEAGLVEALRARGRLSLALLAVQDDQTAGYIAFSPLRIDGTHRETLQARGLAPLAVRPPYQGKGIGTRLVEAGLQAAERKGWDLIFVLGEPDYYARFGFVTAARHGLRWDQICPDSYFMVKELCPGSLADTSGVVCYDKAFALV